MSKPSVLTRVFPLPSWSILPFVILTFAITWGLVGIYVVLPEWAEAAFGPISGSHPFFFFATWAPAISAILLVASFAGLPGLKGFFSRLLLWRCPVALVALVLLGLPVVFLAGSLLKGGGLLVEMPPEGPRALMPLLFVMLLLGPIEEFGWRGLAQPILQRYVAPIWAGAIIGSIWGIWHFPAFLLAGTVFGSWNFLPFFVGNVTLAILVTPLFNRTKGSLLWPMLFHWQLINPFWPDAQPFDTWILVAVTALVVWCYREELFSRSRAVTHVIPEQAT